MPPSELRHTARNEGYHTEPSRRSRHASNGSSGAMMHRALADRRNTQQWKQGSCLSLSVRHHVRASWGGINILRYGAVFLEIDLGKTGGSWGGRIVQGTKMTRGARGRRIPAKRIRHNEFSVYSLQACLLGPAHMCAHKVAVSLPLWSRDTGPLARGADTSITRERHPSLACVVGTKITTLYCLTCRLMFFILQLWSPFLCLLQNFACLLWGQWTDNVFYG